MKIGIVSLGLIGGSLFKCLTQTEHEIYAVTRNADTISKAKMLSQHVSDDYKILKDCDVVFVSSPISKTLDILDELEDIVSSKCLVLDCASVKEFVMKKERPYKFIGSHPMAGTEFTGYNNSFKELFVGAKWVLTPSKKISSDDIQTAKKIIKLTGANPIITKAKEHDIAVALISHMPLILSQALFNSVKDNDLALKLASSGFRDMTRLATSNLDMAEDMKKYNTQNIEAAFDNLAVSINEIKNTKDLKILTDIKNMRSNMYSNEGKNIL